MRRASVGSADDDFVADGVRYQQRDAMAQNVEWSLKPAAIVLLSGLMHRVK